MAHKEQQDFIALVRRELPEFFQAKRVLEVGSLDINGSVRAMFTGCDYVGIDVAPGAGVDIVCEGQNYDAPDNSFDVAISCEVMEHNPYWADTVRNMVRVCKPGGAIIVTCATLGRREHGTARTHPGSSPLTVELGWTYYRNLTAFDFRRHGVVRGLSHVFAYNWESRDLYLIGIKGAADARTSERLRSIKQQFRLAHWTSWRSIRRATKAILLNKRK